MPPPEGSLSGVDALNGLVENSVLVVQKLNAYVKDIYRQANTQCCGRQSTEIAALSADAWNPPATLNALALAQDAAVLIRAHATKISLLIINEPFTPSAISKVVQEVMGGPVPALSNAAHECYGDRYTYDFQRELALRCQRVLTQVELLLNSIPKDGKVLKTDKKEVATKRGTSSVKTNSAVAERGAFTEIGILWTECDSVVALAKGGVRDRLIQIVGQLAETLKDELEELKEWSEEDADDDDDEDDADDDANDSDDAAGTSDIASDDHHASTQAMLDDLMDAGRHIPTADPEGLRPRLEVTLRKIRMTHLLCTAIVKRRIRSLPTLPTEKPSNIAARLDNAMMVLQELPDRLGELAAAFYDLSASRVDSHMGQCFEDAFVASELLVLSWDGKQDTFSDWTTKFQAEIRKL
ncbi:hypothetical protein CMQ_7193 [Grosmannia clavigera kw1407]|uniref:Cyclin-D1-binding protein 1-like N-terminal domain-containing protein n=1 Tax=Grosmannia clavigera (strain kw1407 / UAMH 11150) TaxID=655863 RepID=F0XP74_GROCL|nr:uncharacterized protein CMQ_7193 [Grosmannia clavigera kw1407]EFX00191.1 hypothetical protein CMQ_7193 [Grosmannia clavigera kw1407]